MRKPRGAVDVCLASFAAALALSTFATAVHDVSQAWDSWYYHLPFAARLSGIVPPSVFVFHPANAARFAGFPLLGERVQGVLWRLGGRPEAANLLAWSSVPLFAWFLRARFGVPWYLTVLGLLAVPLVQTHCSSAYVDLPANTALAVTVLLAIAAYASPSRVTARTLALGVACAAVAANMKTLLQPLAGLALAVLVARDLPALVRDARDPSTRRRAMATLGAIALAFPVVFATPIANVAAHGNPFYPLRTTLLGHALPGLEDPYSSSPPWLAGAPRPVRFAVSVLEAGIRPLGEERRWTVDQWMPEASTGNRLGGFFGAYVVVNVVALAWRALRRAAGEARAAAAGFAVVTAVISVMPQSHELRYYLSWMIVLVGTNLWLACRPQAQAVAPNGRALGVVAALAVVVVAAVTRGAYVLPLGSDFQAVLATRVDPRALAGIGDGERVCVRAEPWNLLWASTFHAPRRYVVVEAEDATDCAGARAIE